MSSVESAVKAGTPINILKSENATDINSAIDKIHQSHAINDQSPFISEFKENLAASCKRMAVHGVTRGHVLYNLKEICILLNEQCKGEINGRLITQINSYNKLFMVITDLDVVLGTYDQPSEPRQSTSTKTMINALKEEQAACMQQIIHAFNTMAKEEYWISNANDSKIKIAPVEQQVDERPVDADIFKDKITALLKKEPPKPILKDLKAKRVNLFENYTHYFISNKTLNDCKKTTTRSCFCLYFDNEDNACVLIIHRKGENETLRFRDIARTERDKLIVKKLIAKLRSIGSQQKIQLNEEELCLIAAKCERYYGKTPLSHNELNPLNIFQFSNTDKVKAFIDIYFFKENIRGSFVFDDESHDEGDAYIVFIDEKTSEEFLNQIAEAKKNGYKLIQIETLHDHDRENSIDINDIIDKIKEAYTTVKEDDTVAKFKDELAVRAKKMAIAADEGADIQKKLILPELIRMYIIANLDPDRARKKKFLEQVTLYNKGQSAIEDVVRAIETLYADSYPNYVVQTIPVQQAVNKKRVTIADASDQSEQSELKAKVENKLQKIAARGTFFTAPVQVGSASQNAGKEQISSGPKESTITVLPSVDLEQHTDGILSVGNGLC